MLRDNDLKALLTEIRGVREATYTESEERVAGWNYEQAEGGVSFEELPRSDRYVMLEDYVDWEKYLELGLTRDERAQLMMDAARSEHDLGESIVGYEFGELSDEEARSLFQRLMEANAGRPSLVTLDAVISAMKEAGLGAPASAPLPSPSAIADGERDAPASREERGPDHGLSQGRE